MTWEGIRGTVQWMLVLLVAAAVGGGWYVHRLWSRTDQMVDGAVQAKLAEVLPGWEHSYRRVAFDPSGRVTLSELQLTAAGQKQPAITVRKLVLELDPEALSHRQVVVRRVSLERPEVILARFPDGHWNWERFSPPSPLDNGSPEWLVEDARVKVLLYSDSKAPPQELIAERIDLQGTPEAVRRYLIGGEAVVQHIGRVSLAGLLDPERGEWELAGQLSELRISHDLLSVAADVVPGMSERLAQIIPARFGPQAAANRDRRLDPLRIASLPESDAGGFPSFIRPGPAANSGAETDPLRAEIQVDFRVGQKDRHSPLDYGVDAAVSNGQISELILPVPLYNLNAHVAVDPRRVRIDKFSATNGASRLFLDGASIRNERTWDHRYSISASHLQLDERVCGYLPPALLQVHNQLRPSGTFDLDLDLEHVNGVLQTLRVRRFHAVDCRVLPQMFAYPISSVQGDITQSGNTFLVDMRGVAGDRPITVAGEVATGEAGSVDLKVHVDDLPIDETHINAFQGPEMEGVHHALTALRPRGLADLEVNLVRRPGDDDLQKRLNVHVHEASLNFTGFPYLVENISGDVVFDPLQRNAWIFRNFRGEHQSVRVTADGLFDLDQPPGILALQLSLVGVPVDRDLHSATIVADPSLKEVWDNYGLSGTMDIGRVQIGWSPGVAPIISLYGIQWRNGTLRPAAVPYRWSNVAGALQWTDNRLTIHSLQGWHDGTYMHVDGSGHSGAAYIDFPEEGNIRWQLHLEDIKLMKLNPDDELRRALPAGVSDVVRQLDLQGQVDLQCGFDLKSWDDADGTVTAQWAMTMLMDNNSLYAGLPLSGVSGKVEVLNGEWDGSRADVDGFFELGKAQTLNVPLTKIKGPFRVVGDRIFVGSPAFAKMPAPAGPVAGRDGAATNPYLGKQATAEIYGGRVGLDAEAVLDQRDPAATVYRADMKIEDAELAEWAKDQKIQAQKLRGKVNGELTLSGRGNSAAAVVGDGWVHLTPAELYELPVMAQLLALTKFRPPDDTAFTYGYGDFKINNGAFDFSRIELVGRAISLVGRGYVGFAGEKQSALELDFYSKADSPVPLIRPIIEQFGSRWIRIQVVGTVARPYARIEPRIPLLDDTFEGFMRALDAGRRPPPPPQRRPATSPQPPPISR